MGIVDSLPIRDGETVRLGLSLAAALLDGFFEQLSRYAPATVNRRHVSGAPLDD